MKNFIMDKSIFKTKNENIQKNNIINNIKNLS